MRGEAEARGGGGQKEIRRAEWGNLTAQSAATRRKVRREERSLEIEITAIEITNGNPNRNRDQKCREKPMNTERGPGNGKEDGEGG